MLSYLSKQHHVTAWFFVRIMTDSVHIKADLDSSQEQKLLLLLLLIGYAWESTS